MAAISTIISGVALASTVAGTVTGYVGQQQQAKGQEKAERAREAAMNLDANRRKRQIIRESLLARSTALSNATAQGAQAGSGLQGGYGQIAGQTNQNTLGVNEQQYLGAQVFAGNRQQARGSTTASIGTGLRALGSDLISSAGGLDRIGTYAFG